MQLLSIRFAYSWSPWLLLLLIPAVLLTLIPHFLVAKRYRRTRNRIISLVLHLLIMTLTICVLSGMTFVFRVENPENEIILLVDVSDSEQQVQDNRDDFVRAVLTDSAYDGYNVGIVTFGFTQKYAVPLSNHVEGMYDAYLASLSDGPDATATDISAALRFASGLFDPEGNTAKKIVLITDGKETDESALTVIRAVAMQGIVVDCVALPSEYAGDSVRAVDISRPDYHVKANEECTIGVTLMSGVEQDAVVELYDNGTLLPEGTQNLRLMPGKQDVFFHPVFTTWNLHELKAVVRTADSLEINNEYTSYLFLEEYNKVLVIERYEGDSQLVEEFLTENGYKADLLNIWTDEDLPVTVDDLLQYDQVILNNIANSDLEPIGLDRLLYDYVYYYGGGMLTVGGSDENGNAHAYNRSDMINTLYQQMLPVQAIDYTPPVGVIVILDISGSMGNGEPNTPLWWAKQGAIACLDALTDRDYIGVMTLDTVYDAVLPLTKRTEKDLIRRAIEDIGLGGATNYAAAIDRAGQALVNQLDIDRRHIILVSDGMPGQSESDYLPIIEGYYNTNGVTVTTVGVNLGSGGRTVMENIAKAGHGQFYAPTDQAELVPIMRRDLNMPALKEWEEEEFKPFVANERSPLLNGVEFGEAGERGVLDVTLGGFYGVRIRQSADMVLMGEYEVPIYAQWKFGAGTVGSFMSDLNGRWSAEFLENENSRRFLLNVVDYLMPTENIRPKKITYKLNEGNYLNQLTVFAEIDQSQGESLQGQIFDAVTGEQIASLNAAADAASSDAYGCYVLQPLTASNNYSRCDFVIKQSGTYRISLTKIAADGTPTEEHVEFYKTFSYSEEYLEPEETDDPETLLEALAERGNGSKIADPSDPWEIFDGFITTIENVFDPRWLFTILAIVLFLLDIAVRKFKFKWPHEMVREHREKKRNK